MANYREEPESQPLEPKATPTSRRLPRNSSAGRLINYSEEDGDEKATLKKNNSTGSLQAAAEPTEALRLEKSTPTKRMAQQQQQQQQQQQESLEPKSTPVRTVANRSAADSNLANQNQAGGQPPPLPPKAPPKKLTESQVILGFVIQN